MPERSERPLLVAIGCAIVLVLLLGAVPVVGMVAAIAIPNFVAMQYKAKRAELPSTVEALATAELAYAAAYGAPIPAGDEVTARAVVSRDQRPWRGGPGFDDLGWATAEDVRGAYWIEVQGGSFAVHGVSDLDGDGVLAEYVSENGERAQRLTSEAIY